MGVTRFAVSALACSGLACSGLAGMRSIAYARTSKGVLAKRGSMFSTPP